MILELDKIAVGERTKEEAIRVFGKIKPVADALKMGYAGFHSTYIKGKSLPGAKILSNYYQLGFNVPYILFGNVKEGIDSERTENTWSLNLEIEKLKKENKELKEKLNQIQKMLK